MWPTEPKQLSISYFFSGANYALYALPANKILSILTNILPNEPYLCHYPATKES